jgi:hypothetical protein
MNDQLWNGGIQMLTLEMSYKLLQASFDSLEQDGAMGAKVLLTKDTVVLGPGSPLDSMGLVLFITDVERRFSHTTGREQALVLSAVPGFHEGSNSLSGEMLARHLVSLAGQLTAPELVTAPAQLSPL